MSFDEIFDLTAGVYFNFYNIYIQRIQHISSERSPYYHTTTYGCVVAARSPPTTADPGMYVVQAAPLHSQRFLMHTYIFFSTHIYFPASGQAVVTSVVPSPPRFLPQFLSRIGFSNPPARRFFIQCCYLTLSLSASQVMHKKKSPRMYNSMHSGGLELTKLTCTRLEDNLIRHRGMRTTNLTWSAWSRSGTVRPGAVAINQSMLSSP